MGVQMCRVHIETDMLKDVPNEDHATSILATINVAATLSSCFLYERRVRLHASVSVSVHNLVAATNLAMHAMNLQLADSYYLLEVIQNHVGGAPDFSVHPESGHRETPDDMLKATFIMSGSFPPSKLAGTSQYRLLTFCFVAIVPPTR
jgi:hypothetical protein